MARVTRLPASSVLKTDLLIVGENAGSKYKSQDLGIEIWSENNCVILWIVINKFLRETRFRLKENTYACSKMAFTIGVVAVLIAALVFFETSQEFFSVSIQIVEDNNHSNKIK